MKKSLLLLIAAALVMTFTFCSCGKEEKAAEKPKQEKEQQINAEKYGYAGDDPVEAAVYKYVAQELSKDYEKADVSIPTVNIIATDLTKEDDILAYGDFWIDNYKIDGDTLRAVSGGNYPGLIHLKKDGETCKAKKMDQTEDGGAFDTSAKKIFGEHYKDFVKAHSDDKNNAELRKIAVSDYVNLNGLKVTKFQDVGRDPVKLYK